MGFHFRLTIILILLSKLEMDAVVSRTDYSVPGGNLKGLLSCKTNGIP
jgi:hypothetical protein